MNGNPAAPASLAALASLNSPEAYLGHVMFVSGPEKHCGKTTFLNRAMTLARRGARVAGRVPPAVMTVGYDGEARDFLTGVRKPAVPVQPGDIFVTAERFLRPSGTCPEILDVAPGVGALGRLCLARASRDGMVALVGPEGNKAVSWILETLVEGGLADSVLVDGAINRITQAASRKAARFVYVLRVDRAGLHRAADRVRRIGALMALPVALPMTGPGVSPAGETFHVDGALTTETAARIPGDVRSVVVDDFTKVFLDRSELAAFIRERSLAVARQIEFAGFVVSCRGLSDEEFLHKLDDQELAELVCFNPYRAAAEGAA
ncbi:MAG: hypothetical protein AB7T74_02620 [Clostridia bacterium]